MGTPVTTDPTTPCPACGAPPRPGARFCPGCGAPRVDPAPEVDPQAPTGAGTSRWLLAVGGVAVLLVVGVVLWRAGQDGIDTAATEDRSETDAEPADGGQAVADDVDEDDGAQGGEDEGAGVLDPTPELPPLDLQNAILPSNACSWVTEYLDLPDPLQLVDGEVPNLDMYAFIIVHPVQQPQMVDVDGDGTEEGLLPIQCNAGGSGTTDEVHVLAADGTPLDSFMVGDGVEGRPLLEQMSVEDGAITVLTHGTYPNEALCCGTLPVTEVHPFEDGRFGPVQRTTG